ncbi:MAG: response regulator [Planctomycetes bacterium]|jgi:CheY-like chemotaxis protein|nr:response regulator [Planctomycetota bacterium]MCL4729940.1 response regulator [Planctomycetota bacterium]
MGDPIHSGNTTNSVGTGLKRVTSPDATKPHRPRLVARRRSWATRSHELAMLAHEMRVETSRPRVLVVAANDDMALRVLDTLEQADYHALSAANLYQARARLRAGTFDLVLMDWNLGPDNGAVLIEELRSRPVAAATKLLVMAPCDVDSNVLQTFLLHGACGVLRKPIGPKGLLAAIGAALA